MKQDHIMLDIETMSTDADAAILSIGACMFNPYAGVNQPITEKFLVTISMRSNQDAGRHFDADTIGWWFQQDTAAITALFENATNLNNALTRLRLWFQHETTHRPEQCWANDPDFDVVIIRRAFAACGQFWPIFFSLNRSVRTVGAMAYPDNTERKAVAALLREQTSGTHHRADDDAIAQALFVAHCYETLGVT